MNISKSVIFCIWTVRIFILVAMISAFFIPQIADYYNLVANNGNDISFVIMVSLYVLLIPALATLLSMHILLNNIKKENVFIANNVTCLAIITLCLFVVGIICAIVSFVTCFFGFISVAFLFMGVVLLVLKNVFSKAVEIKEENDLTI